MSTTETRIVITPETAERLRLQLTARGESARQPDPARASSRPYLEWFKITGAAAMGGAYNVEYARWLTTWSETSTGSLDLSALLEGYGGTGSGAIEMVGVNPAESGSSDHLLNTGSFVQGVVTGITTPSGKRLVWLNAATSQNPAAIVNITGTYSGAGWYQAKIYDETTGTVTVTSDLTTSTLYQTGYAGESICLANTFEFGAPAGSHMLNSSGGVWILALKTKLTGDYGKPVYVTYWPMPYGGADYQVMTWQSGTWTAQQGARFANL